MTELAVSQDFSVIEQVVMQGDLSKLTPVQRVDYYNAVCKSIGLNPLTRPFDYIKLNGKLTLYAKKDAAEQLRDLNGVSVYKMDKETISDIYVVTAYVRDTNGREDISTGAVTIKGLAGDKLANALMKAETKAKRRATLSICGLGWLDETELDTIPTAQTVEVTDKGEIVDNNVRELPDRPYPPETVLTGLDKYALKFNGRSATDKQRQLAASLLTTCVGDNELRYAMTEYITGGEAKSMNDVDDEVVLALLEWLKPEKDADGQYIVGEFVCAEAKSLVREALKASGQKEMDL